MLIQYIALIYIAANIATYISYSVRRREFSFFEFFRVSIYTLSIGGKSTKNLRLISVNEKIITAESNCNRSPVVKSGNVC